MNKIILCTAILFTANTFSVNAQEAGTSARPQTSLKAAKAPRAYAHGDHGSLLSDESYDASKKYIVLKFWNANDPLSQSEKMELATMKKTLAAKNVEIIDFEWKSETDLQQRLKGYNLSAKVTDTRQINVSGEHVNLITTSGRGIFVLSENKPVSVCSGISCEERLKHFFKIKSTD